MGDLESLGRAFWAGALMVGVVVGIVLSVDASGGLESFNAYMEKVALWIAAAMGVVIAGIMLYAAVAPVVRWVRRRNGDPHAG